MRNKLAFVSKFASGPSLTRCDMITDDPLNSPIGDNPTKILANKLINAQEKALEYAAIPLYEHAEHLLNVQEELLMSIVSAIMRHGQKALAMQEKALDKLTEEVVSQARTRIATQDAQLAALPISLIPTETEIEGGGRITEERNGECETDYCALIYISPRRGACLWAYCRTSPPPFYDVTVVEIRCEFETLRDAFQWAQTEYPLHARCAEPPAQPPPPPPPPPLEPLPLGQQTAIEQVNGGGPPPQPPPPPPPPKPPPPVGLPPPADYDPSQPPPTDCPPVDPCYPRGLEFISRVSFSASPDFRPAPYWVRVRCQDRCTAVIECYRGDCPPGEQEGWQVYGPYQGCLSEYEKELLVRECLGSGWGNGVPPPPIPEIPPSDWVNSPPINRPPDPDPIPPEECPQPKPIRPEFRFNEYVPVCTTYEEWTGKLTSNLAAFGTLEDVGEWLSSRLDFDAPLPPFLGD